MKKYPLIRKYLTIGVIFFFIGTSIVPSIQSEVPYEKTIITVDDEPGDADFTSIKEAVNSSGPGDTIQVYSGFYPEDGILLTKDNVSLLGVSHELGEGNDSGQPFIKGSGYDSVIRIEASHIIVSNFTIENPNARISNYTCGIFIKHHLSYEQHNITLSDCNITRSDHAGIYASYIRDNVRIIHNHITHCLCDGINILAYSPICSFFIIGNVVTECGESGILFNGGEHQNVSSNRISQCSVGIRFAATNTSVYGNDIADCPIAIRCSGVRNVFIKNNFKNYSLLGFSFLKDIYYPGKNKWIGNYWDTWKGIGPKAILGFIILYWGDEYTPHILLIPWVELDRHPVKEPYDIP
jgi:hypothetical protein